MDFNQAEGELNDFCQMRECRTGIVSIAQLLLTLRKRADFSSIQIPSQIVHYCQIIKDSSDHPAEPKWPTGTQGLKMEFPVHAGLLSLSMRTNIAPKNARLTLAILIASYKWKTRLETQKNSDSSEHKMFANSIYEVWLAVRKIHPQTVEKIDGATFDALYHSTKTLMEAAQPNTSERQNLSRIERFFARFLQIRERSADRNRHVQKRSGDQTADVTPAVDWQSDVESPVLTIWEHRLSAEEVRTTTAYREGNSATELETVGTFFREDKPINCRVNGESPTTVARRKRFQCAHIRRNAHLLPGRWGQLTDDELAFLFLKYCRDVVLDGPAIMLLCLLTGRPIKAVAKTRLIYRSHCLPERIASNEIYIVLNERVWITGVPAPQERRRVRSEWQPVLDEHFDQLTLPIPEFIWARLSRRFQLLPKKRQRSFPMFQIADDVLPLLTGEARFRENNWSRRITDHRTEQHLYSELLAASGDTVEASLLTGRQPPSGTTAALFYHWCSRDHLVGIYYTVMQRWEALVTPTPVREFRQRLLVDGSVGSNLSLRIDAIRALRRDFARDVDSCRNAWSRLDMLPVFQNAYVNYVLLMLLFLTGYRVVRDILDKRSDFDEIDQTLIISDKTADDLGHVRMVPVCPGLTEQLLTYERHASRVRSAVTRLGGRENAGFLFYLTSDCELERVTPTTIKKHFSWAYELHLNSNRHFLRGTLRERGVSGNYVDHFMGHWGIGHEPLGRHSGLDPLHYRRVVGSALQQIADDIGFEVLAGFGVD